MKYSSAFVCLCLVAVVAADGYFIPKAYYKLDAEGHESGLSLISPRAQQLIAHRLRRAAQSTSSSSSSSSSSVSNGGPVFFQQTSSNSVNNGNGGLADRFGGDDSGPSSGPQSSFTQTSGYVLPNGQIVYTSNVSGPKPKSTF